MNIPECFYRVSVKALVLDNEKRFLLVREANGLWELPGGGMDFGESPQDTIRREVMEEMGLLVTHVKEQPCYFLTTLNPIGVHIVNAVYETTFEHLDFAPTEECIELAFFAPEDVILAENMYPNVRAFAKMFRSENHF